MADVLHSTLPDDRLHYPKGATGAAAGTVCTSNGDNTTSFLPLPEVELNLTITDELTSFSTATQMLTSAGDQAQITFGPAAISTGGSMSIDAQGEVTIAETGLYDIFFFQNASRTANNGESSVAFCSRRNGVQFSSSVLISLDNANDGTTGSSTTGLTELVAGDTLTFHMLHVTDNGGSIGVAPVPIADTAWFDVQSAIVSIRKVG